VWLGAATYLPCSTKSRSGGIADWLRTAVVKHWTDNTRVTACTKNVVRRDGVEYPVHWLEDTIARFWRQFLDTDPVRHYFLDQLLLRGRGCVSLQYSDVFAAFEPFGAVKVEKRRPSDSTSDRPRKYFFVKFKTPEGRDGALEAADKIGFKIRGWEGDRPTCTRRPIIGVTKFTEFRPFFVKDVGVMTCVCERCAGTKLQWQKLLAFPHWEIVCPKIAMWIADAKEKAGEFSPSVDNLLDVLLCARPAGGFFQKACCEGTCPKCGLEELRNLSALSAVPLDPAPCPSRSVLHGDAVVEVLNIDGGVVHCDNRVILSATTGRYEGGGYLPLSGDLVASAQAGTKFTWRDLGMYSNGVEGDPGCAFLRSMMGLLSPLGAPVKGSNVCATIHLLYMFVQTGVIAAEALIAICKADPSPARRTLQELLCG
jgi:hypothetical protein